MPEPIKLDDLARDYLAMGVIDEDNLLELYNCLHCEATIMPWWTRCEGCGKNPNTPDPPPTWFCSICMDDEHESEIDANRCYMSHFPIPHWHIRVVQDTGYTTDPICMFNTHGFAEAFAEDLTSDDSSTFGEAHVVQCEDSDRYECKNEHVHEWFFYKKDYGNREYEVSNKWEEETFELRQVWLDENIG